VKLKLLTKGSALVYKFCSKLMQIPLFVSNFDSLVAEKLSQKTGVIIAGHKIGVLYPLKKCFN